MVFDIAMRRKSEAPRRRRHNLRAYI